MATATPPQSTITLLRGDVTVGADVEVEWRRTRRDRAYDLLRTAGDKGVSLLEFHLADVPTPAVHVESLMFEGHAITSRVERTERGGLERRWYMVKDAWA